MIIKKVKDVLSDYSEVFNVRLDGPNGGFDLAMVSEEAADLFINELIHAVERHALEDVHA